MKNKLLLDEEPLLIMPQLAAKIGLNESIILQQIHYWIKINEKADKNYKDGYYWTFNTLEEWQKQFPFWSLKTIQRTLNKLKALNLLICGNYNRLKIDRTIWYRIDYKTLKSIENAELFPLGQNDHMDMDKMTRPLPETTQRVRKREYKRHTRRKDGKYTEEQIEATAEAANVQRFLNKKKEA